MKRRLSPLPIAALCLSLGCETEEPLPPPPRIPPPPPVDLLGPIAVSHAAGAPFVATAGDVAVAPGTTRGLGASRIGLMMLELAASATTRVISQAALTSTGAGPAASAVVFPPPGVRAGRAFFQPTARAQLGAIEYDLAGQIRNVEEAILRTNLVSAFPSALEAPAEGPAASALWVVDSTFGAGGAVRAFPWMDCCTSWPEDQQRAFRPLDTDVDQDAMLDTSILGRLTFAPGGGVGLVAFTFAAPAPQGAAGGIYAFDVEDGRHLGTVIVPRKNTDPGEEEYVQSLAVTSGELLVVTARKDASFADVGGRLLGYRVISFSPLVVEDESPGARYDQPSYALDTATPNAISVSASGALVLTVSAPFGGAPAALQAWVPASGLKRSLSLGTVYTDGFFIPTEPSFLADGSWVLPTEAGLLRATLR